MNKPFNVTLPFFAVFLILFFLSCSKNKLENDTQEKKSAPLILYTPNIIGEYDTPRVIDKMGSVLTYNIPEILDGQSLSYGWNEKEEFPIGFSVFDLSDTSYVVRNNFGAPSVSEFKEGHIYHFVPYSYAYSFSHIGIIQKDQMIVFSSLNCSDRGNSIEDVLSYLNTRVNKTNQKSGVLNRVSNYRSFAKYGGIVDQHSTIKCNPWL